MFITHTGTTKTLQLHRADIQYIVYYCNYLFCFLVFIVSKLNQDLFSRSPSCVYLSVCLSHAVLPISSLHLTHSIPPLFLIKNSVFYHHCIFIGVMLQSPHAHFVQLTSDYICVTVCGCVCVCEIESFDLSQCKRQGCWWCLPKQKV